MKTEEELRIIRNETHKKYSKKHRDICGATTNKYRDVLTEDQKVIGIADSTLMSFKKEKLVLIIRKLEKMVEGK